MPPKEKVSKVRIQEVAFEMTREYGFSSVTARKLADRLGCSTQPIFRAYANMDELREDLFYMSAEFFSNNILAKKSRTKPEYLIICLAYIELARNEKNLFELIASVDDFGTQTIEEFLKKERWSEIVDRLPGMEKSKEDKRRQLFMMLWMFVHGLASLVAANRLSLSDKAIQDYLTKAYEGFKTQIK